MKKINIIYFKIHMIFFKTILAQLFAWMKFSFFNIRIKSVRVTGKILKEKMQQDKKSKFAIIRLIKIILRAIGRRCGDIYSTVCLMYKDKKKIIEDATHLFNEYLIPQGISEIALLGISDMAKVIFIVARETGIKITAIYDTVEGIEFLGKQTYHLDDLKKYQGKIFISSPINIDKSIKKLKKLGVKRENILLLEDKDRI